MDLKLQIGENIVAKFNVNNKSLYVKLLWKDNDNDLFHIQAFYEDKTWTGIYSKESVSKRLMKLDETEEEYNRNVEICLSGNSYGYIIDLVKSPDGNSATFTWKKQYESAIKVHGAVSLQRDEVPSSKDTLIDILLKKNNNLISEIELTKETNNNLKLELEQYIQKLKELTESKILLESTLYGRFVQVLNEKRRRIQLLEENLKSLKKPE